MSKNKVKFNIKNAHYALHKESLDGTIAFEKPVAIPGSVSLALDAQGEISPFYADGIVYYKAASNNGYEGDWEMALLPEQFRVDVLGETLDTKKVLVETINAPQKPFALLFEFDGDQKSIRHVLYNCTATRPSIESQTTEDTKEPVTETLTISATSLPNGQIKAKTGDETDQATYDGWYDAVYVPTEGSGEAGA